MATETTTATTAPRKIHRVRIGVNVLVQVALLLFLAAMVNYLGFEHYKRWDLSRDKKYALSDKTKRFLETDQRQDPADGFLRSEQRHRAGRAESPDRISVRGEGTKSTSSTSIPTRSLSRAKELFDKYKIVSDESLVVVDYEGRNKTVKASEMAEIDQGNPMFGEGPPSDRVQGRASAHQRDDRSRGREEKRGRLRPRTQGAADRRRAAHDWREDGAGSGRAQPDLGSEDVDRERKHQIPGAESVRSPGDSRGAENDHDRRTAIRFLRARDEIAARFLGETGTHPAPARSDREDAQPATPSSTSSA